MSKAITNVKIYYGIGVLIYLSLSIGLESYYRQPLFDKSVHWEKEWQAKESQTFESFFKVLTHFGSEAVLIPLLIVVLLCLPLNKSYSFTCALVYAVYFDNLLKILYGNPRPFWVNSSIWKSCDGGFGNPSGHSFTSSSVYLSFWHLLTDFSFFKSTRLGIIIRIILLILAILLIITIMLTRIFLGVHGVNQVLYGASLGVATYFIIFFVFSIQSWKAEEFFNLFKKKLYIISFSIWYGVLIACGLLVWAFKKNDTTKWEEVMATKCPNVHEYRKYNNDGLFGMLVIICLIGCHYGMMFLIHFTDKKYFGKYEEINSWYNSSSFLNHIYRILIIVFFAIPIVLNFAVPSSSSLTIVYLIKISIPYLLTTFSIFGPAIVFLIRWKFANNEILIDSVTHDIERPYELK